MGASEKAKRSNCVSAWIDHSVHDGTTIMSPLRTSVVLSPSRNRPEPSKT